MNIKAFAFLFASLITLSAVGQVQHGYVRTVNRPGTTVQRLQSVSLRFSGVTNGILSGEKGDFEVILKGKKNGDLFSLLYARKNGYELLDQRPTYNFSDHQDIEIVMADTRLLEAERQRIQERAYRVAEENFNKQLALIEQQREDLVLSEQAYAKRLKELEDNYEKYQSLIGTLADRYARTDYEGLSDLDRQINQCIENGDLMRADSLIKTDATFNPHTAVENKRAAEAEIAEKKANFAAEMERQEQQVAKQGVHDAERFFQLFTIALAQYERDSACFFIRQRAELDTTNIGPMLEAANFITEYMADYDLAKSYYDRAYNNAVAQYGEEHEFVAYCLNDMAEIYVEKDKPAEALKLLMRSLNIRKKCFGEKSMRVAKCYGSLGILYKNMDNLKKAEECLKKALMIYQEIEETGCGQIATAHIDLGILEHKKGNDVKAIEYYTQALPILLECKGGENIAIIEAYHALAGAYQVVDSFALSEQCYKKAIDIERRIYGDNHPSVATTIDNLGILYSEIGKHEEALKQHAEALKIRLSFFPEQSEYVSNSYNNIATCLYRLGSLDKAIEYTNKALQIDSLLTGGETARYATSLANLATMLSDNKQHDEALEKVHKALSIIRAIYGEQHKEVARMYQTIADIYQEKKELTTAIEWYQKSLKMRVALFGEKHSSVATVYNNLGECYREMKDYDKAIEMTLKSININRKVFGKNSPQVMTGYGNLALNYYYKKEYGLALDMARKYHDLITVHYGKKHPKQSNVFYTYALIYDAQGDLEKAIDAYTSYMEIMRENRSDTDRHVLELLMDIYSLYDQWINASPSNANKKQFQQFMQDKHFVCIIHQGAAAERGLDGKYVLLRYNDWSIDKDSEISFISTINAAQKSDKAITLLKDGNMVSHTFSEQKIGVQFLIEFIQPYKKQRLIHAYQEN